MLNNPLNVFWYVLCFAIQLIVEFHQVLTHTTNKVAEISTLSPTYNLVFIKTVSFIPFS
jgi:uncharacterized membrane protein